MFNVKRHVGWTNLRARRLTKVNNVETHEFSCFVAFCEFGLRTQGRVVNDGGNDCEVARETGTKVEGVPLRRKLICWAARWKLTRDAAAEVKNNVDGRFCASRRSAHWNKFDCGGERAIIRNQWQQPSVERTPPLAERRWSESLTVRERPEASSSIDISLPDWTQFNLRTLSYLRLKRYHQSKDERVPKELFKTEEASPEESGTWDGGDALGTKLIVWLEFDRNGVRTSWEKSRRGIED
ncbi:MAG: hypothetical protein ACTS43_01120 [Candidatus Hodgkinia cicadicola]